MKPSWFDLVLLYILSLLVNGAVALLVAEPGFSVDAHYYYNGAHIIMSRNGLLEPYIWNYLSAPTHLPAPAFGYWQPGASYLAAAGIAVFGDGAPFGSAQAIFVIVAGTLPILAYSISTRLSDNIWHARLAGILCVFSGFYALVWSLPESFTPFAVSTSACLYLIGSGIEHKSLWTWPLAGAAAAIAYLTRSDGLLLAVMLGIGCALYASRYRKPLQPDIAPLQPGDEVQRVRLDWPGAALRGTLAIGMFVLVSLPWVLRNLMVFDTIQPGGGLYTAFLIDYNDIFTFQIDGSTLIERFLQAGVPTIAKIRWNAFVANLASVIAVNNLIVLTPLTLIGCLQYWRNRWVLPWLVYGLGLFVAMTFVFALPGMRGGFYHSSGALMPVTCALAPLGLDTLVGWGAKLRGWKLAEARRVFSASLAIFSILFTCGLIFSRVIGLEDYRQIAWNQSDTLEVAVREYFERANISADVRVMSNNPPGLYNVTGLGGVPVPAGNETMLLRAADHYKVSYLLLTASIDEDLWELYQEGPKSDRLELLATFGTDSPAYLYRVISDDN